MTMSVENLSPESAGLLAARSGFALVEEAFIPMSLRIKPVALWFVAVISLGALAAAAGLTAAGDLPVVAVADELPAVAEAIAPAPVQSAAARAASAKRVSVLPVVLRGQPPSRAGHRS